jgi:hypothetical protein
MPRNLGIGGLLLVLAVARTGPLVGQDPGRIQGRVLDQGGRPVPDAQVGVDGGTASAASDKDGGYTLDGVTAGEVKLTVQARTCLPVAAQQLTVTAGQTLSQDLTLYCTPRNRGYMVAAYLIAGIVYFSYAVSLMLRARQASRATG